jgi:hypothetical protein
LPGTDKGTNFLPEGYPGQTLNVATPHHPLFLAPNARRRGVHCSGRCRAIPTPSPQTRDVPAPTHHLPLASIAHREHEQPALVSTDHKAPGAFVFGYTHHQPSRLTTAWTTPRHATPSPSPQMRDGEGSTCSDMTPSCAHTPSHSSCPIRACPTAVPFRPSPWLQRASHAFTCLPSAVRLLKSQGIM